MTSPVHITRTIRELESWTAKREAANVDRVRRGDKPLSSGTLISAARQLTEYRDHLDRELHPVTRPIDGDACPAPGCSIDHEHGGSHAPIIRSPVVEELPAGSPEPRTGGIGLWPFGGRT